MKFLNLPFFRVCCLSFIVCLITSCGKQQTKATQLEEAYSLLDAGDNLKAIVVLEKEVKAHPNESDEARTLLASAYMGAIGIDIFSIFDSFQEFIFKKSLKDQFFAKKSEDSDSQNDEDSETILSASSHFELNEVLKRTKTEDEKVKKFIRELDKSLVIVQKFSLYFNRFPQVASQNWPLIESALYQLSLVKPSSDLFVYQLFIRLLYLKSYINVQFLKNPQFSTKKGLCTFSLNQLSDPLHFSVDLMHLISSDLNQAVSMGATRLRKTSSAMNMILRSTEWVEIFQVIDQSFILNSTVENFESQLRKKVGCI